MALSAPTIARYRKDRRSKLRGRKNVGASLSTSLRPGSGSWRSACKLDDSHRSVIGDKCFVRYSPYVGLRNFVDALDGSEQLPPIVVKRLIQAERERQTLIRSE